MLKKVLAGFLWAVVAALLVAILFKFIPWDSATKTVFWIVFILAVITLSASQPPKGKPLAVSIDSEKIQVSIAGRVYKGKQVSALRLAGGGVLINVDPMAREKIKDEEIQTTKKPQKVQKG